MGPRTARLLREVMLWVGAVLGLACLAVTVAGVAFGVKALVFRSGSMSPTISTGALAFAHPVDAADLRVGDVVSIPVDGQRVTHRIAHLVPEGESARLILRGDANPADDAQSHLVRRADRVFLDVPGLGYVVAWFGSPAGLVSLALLAGLGLVRFSPPAGRHKAKRLAPTIMVFALGSASLGAFGVARVAPTLASWTDTAAALSSQLRAYTVTKPAILAQPDGCKIDTGFLGLGPYVATITWTAAQTPSGQTLGYSAAIRQSPATALQVTGTGSTRSVSVSKSLLGSLLGATVDVDITAALPGTPTWRSVSTQQLQVALLGLGLSCGSRS